MEDNELYDLVIVGGGPGGLSAGIYAMRAVLKTVLIEKGAPGGQMTMFDVVENWPGVASIGGFDLSENFVSHAKEYGLEMVQGEVVAVEPGLKCHCVRLADGTIYRGHAVILATGGSPRKLGIPGEDENYGRGVSYCAVCDGFFYKNKTVAVVGGGDSAVEESLYLAKLAKKVYLVHRRDTLRAGMILQERLRAEPRIQVLWNTVVREVLADSQGVTGVLLGDLVSGAQSQLEVDGLFVFIGFDPNNQLVPAGTAMDATGYVTTDIKCESNTPGIYIVGDLRHKYAKQIVVAAGEGATAALAAAHYVERTKGHPVS
jgi:thioredoxin reductase (NADPH)